MSERTVSVRLKAEVAGYVSGMHKAAQATRSLADDARRHVGTVSQQLAGMSRGAQIVGAVGAVALGRQFVNAARDMNETVSKTRVVFGDAADSVIAWSKGSAKAMGMSEQQADEAASTFGNLFVSMRIGQRPAADMSKNLVQLAGDLASFNNADPTDTLEALRSGLVGEVEPLRKYGVNLSEVTLKQKAMEMGLVSTTTGVLPPAIRTQAAYALILEQTKTAQGDFARTADGLANSQRTLNAEWQNTQAQLGQELLPIVNAGTKELTRLLGVVNALPEPVRLVAVGVGVAAAAFLLLAPRAVDTYDAFKRIETASPRAGRGIAAVGKAAGLATAALVAAKAAAAVWDSIADSTTNAGMGANELQQTLERIARTGSGSDPLGFKTMGDTVWSFNDAIDASLHSGWADEFFTQTTGLDTNLAKARSSIDQVDKALASMVQSGHADEAAAAVDVLRRNWIATGGSAEEFDGQLNDYRDAIVGATGSTNAGTDAIDAFGNATSDAADEVKTLADRVDGLRGTQMSADEATSNLEEAIDKATAAAKENGKAISLNTQKGRDNQAALRDIATAALDGIDAWSKNGASAEIVAGKVQEARNAFIRTARQMGLTKKAAEELANKFGLIPATVKTVVKADTSPAEYALDSWLAHYKTVREYIASHPAKYKALLGQAGGGPVLGMATGGPVYGAGTSTSDDVPRMLSVGEYVVSAAAAARHRPELDAMNYGRDTRSAAARYGAGAGSGGGNVYVNVQIPPTVRPADRALIREQVTGAVQEAMAGVGAQIAWRGKR